MAVVTLYYAVPFAQVLYAGPDVEGDVLSYSATQITFVGVGSSSAKVVFLGQFNFTPDGFLTSGTLAGYTIYNAGIKQFDVSGLSVDMDRLFDVIDTGSEDQLGALLFGGADRFTGSTDDDELRSYGGNDTVNGGAGNDTIDGGAGNDTINGGSGNDTIIGGAGNDFLDGGEGFSTSSLSGGSGSDTYVVRPGTVIVETDASASGGVDMVQLYADFDTLTLPANVENAQIMGKQGGLTGNALGNVLVGGVGNDGLAGGGGNDDLRGGDGHDGLKGEAGSDTLAGGAGNDKYSFPDSSDLLVESSGGGYDSVTVKVNYTLTSTYIERIDMFDGAFNVTGSNGPNLIRGNAAANTINGLGGDDSLWGGGAADTLIGGDGNDVLQEGSKMTGGAGNDVYVVSGEVEIVELSGGGIDTVQIQAPTYTLPSEVENLEPRDNGFVDAIGNASSNKITGDINTNRLTGGDGHDSLYGNDGADTLGGGNGNDVLDGGTGNDSMTGGAGNDRYLVQSSADKVVEASAGGTDSVSAGITYTLPGEVEKLTLTGSSAINGSGNTASNTITGNDAINSLAGGDGNDSLYGNGGIDTLGGGNGNDLLDGGTGNDSMTGGAGDDLYVVQASADKVIEASGGGTDSVSSSIAFVLPGAVERLTLTGNSAIDGSGNSASNRLTGNAAINSLSGGNGNDVLDGGGGNDNLTGGGGLDTFRFSSALNGSTNADRLLDFNVADDRLQLENSIFTKLATTGVLAPSFFRANTSGTASDGNDFVLYETDTGKLFYDADGNGAGAKVLIATLTTLPTLTSADIFVT